MSERQLRDLGVHERLRQETGNPRDESHSATPADLALLRRLMEPLSRERADAILDRALASPSRQTARTAGRTKGRTLAAAALLFAAAAALLLLLGDVWPARPDPLAPGQVVAAALDYELTVAGAVGVGRGVDRTIPTFARGDRIELRLRPRDETRPPLHVSVRATQGGRVVVLPWESRPRGTDGVFEVAGPADDLLREGGGEWELAVEVGNRAGGTWRGNQAIRLVADAADRP